MTITDVFETYKEDLRQVETQIVLHLGSRAEVVKHVGEYLLSGGGKRIRPLLLMIAARLGEGAGGLNGGLENALKMGAMVEFIHTASLLHDDVVDGADIRRGRASANAVWGNQAIVLIGDYLYSRGIQEAILIDNQRIVESLSRATTAMSEGEILQLQKSGDPEMTEEDYFEIIEAKTAALISSSCQIGAVLGGMPPEKDEALAGYGLDLGRAYQLLDDALDYTARQDKLGKTLGKDLGEGKLTLPLIHLLTKSQPAEAVRIKDIIARKSQDKEDLEYILSLMREYRSIEFAVDRAKSYIESAKARLAVFPAGPHKDALCAVADYVVEREM
ncbi:MAG TPA: polyprenyl synthetase family protein [Nitrospirota bacterium]|jgi:octaprenyl-diphosphate synthase